MEIAGCFWDALTLHQEPMSRQSTYKQTSLRLPEDFLDRADTVLEGMANDKRFMAFGTMTRADVLRLALQRGLDVLESELEEQGEQTP